MTYRTNDTTKRFSSGTFGIIRPFTNQTSGEGQIPFSDHHNWRKFSSNGLTHVAIDDDGRLWGWGEPPVGDGTLLARKSPVLISDEEWLDVSVGSLSTTAAQFFSSETGTPLPREDQPRGWYRSPQSYVLAIKKSDGSLWGWGPNEYGTLGNGRMSRPFCVSTHGVLSSGIKSVSLVNTGKNLGLYSAPLVGNAIAVDPLSPVVDVTRLWAEAGVDLDAPLRIQRTYQTFLPEYGGFYQPPLANEEPLSAYGSGAVVRPRYYIAVRYVPTAMQVLFSGSSGYRGTPTVESFVVRGSTVSALGDDSVPAAFDVLMSFQVEGVQSLSQSRPYTGDVAVVFSPGDAGADAKGFVSVDSNGFVTGVTITSPGDYSQLPTVTFHGTGGDATASPLCNGTVRGVIAKSEGEYREPGGVIGFRLAGTRAAGLGDPPSHVASHAGASRLGLAAYIDGFIVSSQGSGYSSSAQKPLCVILDTPSTAPSWISSLVVGTCNLSSSGVVSLDSHFVGNYQPPLSMRVETFRDRFRVSDAFKPLPGDGLILASTFNAYFGTMPQRRLFHPAFSLPNTIQPSAEIRFSGSGRTVALTVSQEGVVLTTPFFRLSLSSDISYSVADGLPYIQVTWPGVVYVEPPPQVPSAFQNPQSFLIYRSTLDRPFIWYPGVTYENVDGYRFSWESVDRFLGGDLLTHQTVSLHEDQVGAFFASPDIPLYYSVYNFINTYRKTTTSPPCASILGIGIAMRPDRPREHVRLHATAAEPSGEPAVVTAFYDTDSPLATGSHDVVRFSLGYGGDGYESEPLFFATNFDLSPRLCDAARSYTDVQAGTSDLHMCCAISGGRIYEWGHSSPTRSMSPTLRGFKLEVTVLDVPNKSIIDASFTSWIPYVAAVLDLACPQQTPVTGEFRATAYPSIPRWEVLPNYSVSLEADKYAVSLPLLYQSPYYYEQDEFILSFGLPEPYSRDWAANDGGAVFVSTESGYTDAPASLPLNATARVLKPQEPVKSLHPGGGTVYSQGVSSIIVIDANDELWVLDQHQSNYTQRVYDRVESSAPRQCFAPSGSITVRVKGTALHKRRLSQFPFEQDIPSWALESSSGSLQWSPAPPLYDCPLYYETPNADYREATLLNGEYVEYREDSSTRARIDRDVQVSGQFTARGDGDFSYHDITFSASPPSVIQTQSVPQYSAASLVWSGRPTG
jgi:hypothetical protein